MRKAVLAVHAHLVPFACSAQSTLHESRADKSVCATMSCDAPVRPATSSLFVALTFAPGGVAGMSDRICPARLPSGAIVVNHIQYILLDRTRSCLGSKKELNSSV